METQNRTELARELGIARSTLYGYMALPDCPDADTQTEDFKRFCRGLKAENRGLPGRLMDDSGGDSGSLKLSKLRADTLAKWGAVREYEAALVATVADAAWEQFLDCMAAYRMELERQHAQLSEAANLALNESLKMIEEKRKAAKSDLDESIKKLRRLVLNNKTNERPENES